MRTHHIVVRRSLVALIGGAVAATVAVPTGIAAATAPPPPQPEVATPQDPKPMRSVPGRDAASSAPGRLEIEKAALRRTPDVRWPAYDVAEVAPGARTQAGPVTVGTVKGRSAAAPGKVKVEVLGRDAARKEGVAGLLVRLRRADGKTAVGAAQLSVDYDAFRYAYGGDWGARLRLTTLDGEPVPSRNNVKAGTVTAPVKIGGTATTFALAAAAEGSTGDYKATSLSPSGTWQVSQNSGTFSWSYPLRTVPVPGKLAPSLAASYSSAGADGRTVSANSQPSWLGEGWDLGVGFVERSYKGCADDLGGNNGQIKTGDMCWETENATMSIEGMSTPLVHAGNNVWRPKKDDGSRVEHLFEAPNGDDNGEFWKLTKPDGTQYVFGRRADSAWHVPVFGNDAGEPCHRTAYADSDCTQTYRWNLDHVVDTHGNTINYVYERETNKYGLNIGKETVEYTRGGHLLRVEYGHRNDQGTPPARVEFTTADRCVPGTDCSQKTKANWPDVPWDLNCAAATCGYNYSPSFWTAKRLAKITTYAGSQAVDQWAFDHSYPEPGDAGGPALWLNSITHTGLAGTAAALPAVRFDGTAYPNRVDTSSDALPALHKYRIRAIHNESGGQINIKYAPTNCVAGATQPADTNKLRCFPVRWALPPAPQPTNDWFHKYVVEQVSQVDGTGGAMAEVTTYDYVGDAAWHYQDNPLVAPDKRTWTDWRGYERVIVRHGDPAKEPGRPVSEKEYVYFRGMHGDKLAAGGTKSSSVGGIADEDPYAGFLREEITRNGSGGAEVSASVHDPWKRGPIATDGSLQAFQVEKQVTTTRTPVTGGVRTTQVVTAHDQYGNVTFVNDRGDLSKESDDRCTRNAYLTNRDAFIHDKPYRSYTVGVACDGGEPSYPADAIKDERYYYDGRTAGNPPLVGNLTRVEEVSSYVPGDGGLWPVTTVSDNTYDDYGRVLTSTDALARTTTTAYSETAGLTTGVRVTNPLGHTKSTTFDPGLGLPTVELDANGLRTDLAYDGLGRLTGVWLPGRNKASGQNPNSRFSYAVLNNAPSYVKAETLKPSGSMVASYTLLDGFLRERQTQVPSASAEGGRVLVDTRYDSRGMAYWKTHPYWNSTAGPGTTLFVPLDHQVPGQTLTLFDGAERPVVSAYLKYNVESKVREEQWRTTTSYGGDHVSVTPPTGGTATTTYTDARGQKTELRQYHGPAPTGTFDATSYTYTKDGQLATIKDAAGNVWGNEYDVRGRKVRVDDPDKGAATLVYDDADQLVSTTDARDKTVTFTYDKLGRKTETRRDSATGDVLASWTYDTLAKGNLTSSSRFIDGKAYTKAITGYDAVTGRPQGEQVTIPSVPGEEKLAGTYKTLISYKVDGSPATTAVPALGDLPSETLLMGYTALGLPRTLIGATTYVEETKYTALNEQSQQVLGDYELGKQVWKDSFYEEGTRRLVRTLTKRQSTSSFVERLDYRYDPAGNITSILDEDPGRVIQTQCFDYDHLRRTSEVWTEPDDTCATAPSASVVGGSAAYWNSYAYDVTGNRKSETRHGVAGASDVVSTYAYPAAGSPRPHAVTSVATTGKPVAAYGYDAAGNTTTRPGQTLTWDVDGSLASVGDTSYVYDADGTQLLRRDKDAVTLFVGGGEVRLDKAIGITKGTRYYGTNGTTAVRTSAGVQWLVADHHNTSQVAVNASTLAMTTRKLDLFGNERGTAPASWPGSRSFVGGTQNKATGLTRLGAREYDPALGKFLSVDPIIDTNDPQQFNAYSYSNNAPATKSDPSGLIAHYDMEDDGTAVGISPEAAAWVASMSAPSAPKASGKPKGGPGKRFEQAEYEEENERIRIAWGKTEEGQRANAAHRAYADILRAQSEREEQARAAAAREAACDWWCRRGRNLADFAQSKAFGQLGTVIGLLTPICGPACALISIGMSAISTGIACSKGEAVSCGLNAAGTVLGIASFGLGGLAAKAGQGAITRLTSQGFHPIQHHLTGPALRGISSYTAVRSEVTSMAGFTASHADLYTGWVLPS